MSFTVGGLFSGVGGIELGFEQSGYEILWANEFDKYANRTYKANFSHRLLTDDIYDLKGKELENVDVLVGGFPCQAFSLAGYREGFKDERGNLFFEITRLIEEMKQKPRVLLLENVKNFRTHDKGNTFQVVRTELEKLEYSVLPKVLNTSKYTAVPQNRERIFIICFRNELDWEVMPTSASRKFDHTFPPEEVDKTDHFRDYLEKEPVDEKYYYRKDKYNYKELKKNMLSDDRIYQWRRKYVRENKSGVCPTLTANMGTGGHNVPLIKTKNGIRKLTPRECFNLQGFPKTFVLPEDMPNSQLYKQAGNSVTVALVKKLAENIKKAIS